MVGAMSIDSTSEVTGEETLSLSEEITLVFDRLGEEATIGDLVKSVEHKGFGFLFVIMSLIPVLPGTSGIATPFGILCALLAFQIIAGRNEPWFPDKILRKRVGSGLRKVLTSFSVKLRKIEKMLKPRMSFLFHKNIFRFGMAPVLAILGFCIALPFPGVNSIAGLAVFLIGLGMLEDDGLFGLAGVGIAVASFGLAIVGLYFVIVYGADGLNRMRDMLRGR